MANWYVAPAGAEASDGNDSNAGSTLTLIAAAAATPTGAGDTLTLDDEYGTWAALGVSVGDKVTYIDTYLCRSFVVSLNGRNMVIDAFITSIESCEVRVGGPCAIIQLAYGLVGSGDTIYIKPGAYDIQVVVTGAVFPAEANVEIAETAYGPTGAEYAGELDLAAAEAAAAAAQLVTDKGEVDAEKANIKTGTTILTKAGSYPTTETSKAAQLADDKEVVLAAAADIRDGATILDQEGELDLPAVTDVRDGTTFDGGTKEGSLDLPAVADVRDTVKFDGETKTGTYDPTAAAVFPDVSAVWFGSGLYGPSGEDHTPTKRASSIVNCVEANIASGVTIDDVTGTLTNEIASQRICDAIRDLKSGFAAVRL